MSPPDWPDGVGLDWLEQTDSTNVEALRRAAAGEYAPIWIAAHEQSAGQGRQNRLWRAERGDLKASLLFQPSLLRPDVKITEIASLSMVAALALADALTHLRPGLALTLKWPNDVLLCDRKIAGILVETQSSRANLHAVIGVGVNLVSHPPAEILEPDAWPPGCVADSASPPEPAALLSVLSAAMAHRLRDWAETGFEGMRGEWRARAARLGREMRVRIGDEPVRGRFVDIDADGALLLDAAEGRLVLHAADVLYETEAGELGG